MFSGRYFSARYFSSGYFARRQAAPVIGDFGYFPHGYFARSFFPDRYFPGPDLQPQDVEQPSVEVGGAARFPVPFAPDVYAVVRLSLALQLRARAVVEASDIQVRPLALALGVHGSAILEPLEVHGHVAALPVDVSLATTVQADRPARKSARQQDEDDLDAYYLSLMEALSRES